MSKMRMLRCCLACVLPCGVLDVIRIVHLNGYIEEITHRPITASEIIKANPNHVLISKPTNSSSLSREEGSDINARSRIIILSPETELKRGGIYFLIPDKSRDNVRRKTRKRNVTETQPGSDSDMAVDVVTSRKSSDRKEHRCQWKKRVEVWTPHLDSIFED